MKKSLNKLLFILILVIIFIIFLIIKLRSKDLTTSKPISLIDEIGLCGTIMPKKRNNGMLEAISHKKYAWNPAVTRIIRIKFLNFPFDSTEPNSHIKRTYNGGMDVEVRDINKNVIIWDPLEEDLIDLLGYEYDIIDAIRIIIRERYKPLINIPIKFVSPASDAEIRITFDITKGNYSLVGNDALNIQDEKLEDGSIIKAQDIPTMNFSSFEVASILHEFGHAFGLLHEHQSPFGNEIIWNLPAIEKYYLGKPGWDLKAIEENFTNREKVEDVNGTIFDPDSIMLYSYPANFTCLDRTCKIHGEGTKSNKRLSPIDIAYLTVILYPPRKIQTVDIPRVSEFLENYYYKAYDETFDEEYFPGIIKYLLDNPHTKDNQLYVQIF